MDTTLHRILKSHDRIGFGRRGVLDAEEEICRVAAGLASDDRTRLRQRIVSWITAAEAERVAAQLHYNLQEHVQALALRLCASLPIPESLPLLRGLQAEGAFAADHGRLCHETLRESVRRLSEL